MNIQSIEVLREVYRLWNLPSTSRLDSEAVVDALNRVYQQRVIEFGLSGGSFLAKVSDPFYADSTTRTVLLSETGIDENVLNFRVEVSASDSQDETYWREVKLGDYADWGNYQNRNELFAAIYGSASDPTIIFNHSPENLLYRLIYEPAGETVRDAPDGLEMPPIFQPLLVYDTAIEAGILIDDDSPEFARKLERNLKFLAVRQGDALALFKRWLATRNSQSVETRQGFNERGNPRFGVNMRGIPANLYLIGGTNNNSE